MAERGEYVYRITWSSGEVGTFHSPALTRREALRAVREYVVTSGDLGAVYEEV